MKNNWILTIVIVIIVGAGAFYGGMQYEKSKAAANTGGSQYAQGGQFQGGANGQAGGRFGGRRGGFGNATIGQITSQDANSITIKLQDGSSKIVNISSSTKITKMNTASQSDLTTGTRVAAIGTTNSDGSVTAQNIQINPMFRPGQGGQQNPQPTQ